MQWLAVDLEHARIRVEHQLKAARDAAEDAEPMATSRGPVAFGPPKSRRSVRTVALDAATVEALREHRHRQMLERDLAGPAYVDHDLVFADELGRPIHPQTLTDRFPKVRKAAGIPAGTLHVLRHTAVTLMLTSGIPLHVVAARTGDDPKRCSRRTRTCCQRRIRPRRTPSPRSSLAVRWQTRPTSAL